MKIRIFGINIKVSKDAFFIIIISIAVIIFIAAFNLINKDGEIIIKASGENNKIDSIIIEGKDKEDDETKEAKEKVIETSIKEMIYIDIEGCILNPGVYEIEKGKILNVVIEMAGGLTDEADKENINRAYELTNNLLIKINKKKSEEDISNIGGMEIIRSIKANISGKVNDGILKININTATQNELEMLPDIGPVRAKAIMEYRDNNDDFNSKDEIMKVKGIGISTFEKISELIVITY